MAAWKNISFVSLSGSDSLKSTGHIFGDPVIRWSSVLNIALIIITTGLILFKFKPSSDPAALHYNVLTGVDWVGRPSALYLLPLLVLVIWMYNMYLAKKYRKFEPFAAQILAIASTVVTGIVMVAVLAIISFEQ